MILEDWALYRDGHGLVSDRSPPRTTGNGLLYTSEMVYALEKYGVNYDRKKLLRVYEACEHPLRKGVFHRNPSKTFGSNAPDDYFGIALSSYYLDRGEMSKRILIWGRNNNWNFRDLPDDRNYFKFRFDRMPQLMAHIKLSAGEWPNMYEQFVWSAAIIYSLFKANRSQDSHAKAWSMTRIGKDKGGLYSIVSAIYSLGFKIKFPDGIGQVRKEYGWDESHPTVKYLWGSV